MTLYPDHVIGWEGSLKELAITISLMRYDAMAELLALLTAELQRQASADYDIGRWKLSAALFQTIASLSKAKIELDDVWAICAPHMTDTPPNAV